MRAEAYSCVSCLGLDDCFCRRTNRTIFIIFIIISLSVIFRPRKWLFFGLFDDLNTLLYCLLVQWTGTMTFVCDVSLHTQQHTLPTLNRERNYRSFFEITDLTNIFHMKQWKKVIEPKKTSLDWCCLTNRTQTYRVYNDIKQEKADKLDIYHKRLAFLLDEMVCQL